ncbi:MAG: hypothetical protein ACRDWX_09425, partial [Acidimicrobiia bacterium]
GVNGVGEPDEGEPHVRFDGGELETEQVGWQVARPHPGLLAAILSSGPLNGPAPYPTRRSGGGRVIPPSPDRFGWSGSLLLLGALGAEHEVGSPFGLPCIKYGRVELLDQILSHASV